MNQRLESEIETVRPDLLIGIKAELVLPDTIRRLRLRFPSMRTVLWFTDDPRYFNSLLSLIAPAYQHIFSVSPVAVKWYSRIGIHEVHHLPVGCDPDLHRPIELSSEDIEAFGSDICFVGTYYPNRARILRRLQKSGFRVKVWGKFWTRMTGIESVSQSLDVSRMARAFTAAKVILNIHHPMDIYSHKLNMRTFEATASRGFLLTDRPKGLEEFFSPNRELVCYDSEDDLLQRVQYYIHHDSERQTIAYLGQQRAYRDHTYRNRAMALLEAIGVG
jgi:spore maturation protein CgeB